MLFCIPRFCESYLKYSRHCVGKGTSLLTLKKSYSKLLTVWQRMRSLLIHSSHPFILVNILARNFFFIFSTPVLLTFLQISPTALHWRSRAQCLWIPMSQRQAYACATLFTLALLLRDVFSWSVVNCSPWSWTAHKRRWKYLMPGRLDSFH